MGVRLVVDAVSPDAFSPVVDELMAHARARLADPASSTALLYAAARVWTDHFGPRDGVDFVRQLLADTIRAAAETRAENL